MTDSTDNLKKCPTISVMDKVETTLASTWIVENQGDNRQTDKLQEKEYSHPSKLIPNFKTTQNNWKTYTTRNTHPLVAEIKELIRCPPEYVIQVLCDPRKRFGSFITDVPQDLFFHVLQLLQQISYSTANLEQKSQIFSLACNSKFLEHFSTQIIVVGHTKMETNELKILLTNMIIFFETIFEMLPYNTLEMAYSHIKGCLMCIKELKSDSFIIIEDVCCDKLETLVIKLELLQSKGDSMELSSELFHQKVRIVPPPNNFRSLTLFPTEEEILKNERPHLKPNKIGEQYKNVEDYLDVQFRLLREDFLRPLREGINAYKNTGTRLKSRDSSIRIYSNVQFERSTGWEMDEVVDHENTKKQGLKFCLGTKVKFINTSKSKLNRIDWKTSKFLMHNSFVCFTSNDFKTLLVATVRDRSIKHLSKGLVYVDFCEKYNENIFNSTYMMFESEVYFEPYYHVLKTLQNIHSFSLPMSKYLVDACPDSYLPQYSAMPNRAEDVMFCKE